jgi:hypothetical protein
MGGMDAGDVDQAMAELRLRDALERHIEETEPVPVEVREAVGRMFPERPCPHPDSAT